jgi:cytoskeletal protein RodZ
MATPRRAAPGDDDHESADQGGKRRGLALGILIGVLIIAAAVGAIFVVQNRAGSSAHEQSPSHISGARQSASADPSQSPTPSPSPTADQQAVADAVSTCTHQVEAADAVITAATTGIDHWSQHVQAQTDHLNGTISRTEMEATFKRTKLLGPSDETAWQTATKAWHADDSACAPVSGADQQSQSTLQLCSARLTAVEQAMPAARNGMSDWFGHLASMKRSAAGMDPDPMATWMTAWHHAPKNLDAWKSAKDQLADVPKCTR